MAQVFNTVISLRLHDNSVRFYSAVGGDKSSIRMEGKPLKSRLFSDEFYHEFTQLLTDYAADKVSHTGKAAGVTILVPDTVVLTDSVNVPGTNRKAVDSLTALALEARYRNIADLRYNKYVSSANRQYSTVGVVLIRQKLLQALYTCCSGCNMIVNVLTYEANALVDGAMALNGKLKGGSFVLLDIKEGYSRICYVVRGVTVGYYDLPFGYGILWDDKLAVENMLFDHTVAEIAVFNAKKRARAKQLAAAGAGNADVGGMDEEAQRLAQSRMLPKKVPHVLPKNMQRPLPTTPQGYEAENFRIFVKWVLEFIEGNPRLRELGDVDTVYVNMPDRYAHVLDTTNREREDNGVAFASLGIDGEKELISRHLELYGGLFASQYNTNNNF